MKLVAQSGPLAGQELPLDKPVIVLGRGLGSDVLLEDPESSRRHTEIRFSGDQVSVSDLGSMNGTFVNGVRIQGTQVLKPGDEIRIGASRFVLQKGLAPVPAVVGPAAAGLAEPPPSVAAGGSKLGLILGGVALLVVLAIAAVVAFVVLGKGDLTMLIGGGAPPTTQAALSTTPATPGPPQGTPVPSGGATATSLVQPFVTLTKAPASTVVSPTAGGASGQPGSTPQPPPFTVSWSPGRYEGWAEGKRMSSDLTITNHGLPEIKPPYTPYFIISDPKGKMRQAELHDYSEGKEPPTIAKGQTILWTWFGVMNENEWVRGSVFRYAGYAWAQEFNPDGSLAGPPRVIDEKNLAPFLPKEVPPEMIPTIAATMAAGGGTGVPTGMPTGMPTGTPKP